MINGNSKEINQKENEAEPLMVVPEANLAIYPDRIQLFSKKKDNSISAVNTTILSVHDGEATDKVIPFKSDFAFKIDEKKRKISIITINSEKIQFEFIVQKVSQLIIIQGILRRKLCEMGFEEKFKILKQLGKGATAKVYLVQRFSDKRLFAAKIISIKQASNKEYETFINETKIIKSLKNPYILAIESLYISKKELICVVEYLEGGTLLEQLKNDVLKTKRQKFKAIKDIAQGLDHLRQKRIVHRDLKLENIMVRINKDKSKDYVIADYGLACWIGEKNLLYQKCGTPGYIAPEILRAPKGKVIVSHSSDVFSFGVICHFILLLKAVFPYNGNPKDLLINNKKATFSLQTNNHLALMVSQQQLLKKTLEIDPQKRISAEQIVKIYIPNYQKQLILQDNKKKKVLSNQKEKQQKNDITNKRHKIQLSSSIQMIQKRPPSVEKQQFSNRMRTEEAKSVQKQQREGSVSKFFGKVWNKISRSNTQVLKKKEEAPSRKKQMKDFIL